MSDNDTFPMSKLPVGCKAKVFDLKPDMSIKRRLLDLGLIQNTVVEAVLQSPAGDPVAYMIRGALIALRSEDASNVILCSC